jgi:hypothetical protein
MLLDSTLCFDAGVAITATRVSTNVIDLGVKQDIAIGTQLPLMVIGDGLFASAGGTATLTVSAQTSPDNATWTDSVLTPALTITQLNLEFQQPYLLPIMWPRPRKGLALPRYLRLNYTVGTQNFSAGSVQAYLVLGRDDVIYYPRNFTVDINP